MTETPRRAMVVYSPHSGRSSQLLDALAHLRGTGIEVARTIAIAELDDLPSQGAVWREQGAQLAIAAGGDGLVGGVITHIAESGLPLGILPLGTGNDIARTLRIPQDIGAAAQVIATGAIQNVDVGTARPAEQAPHLASKGGHSGVLSHLSQQKHGFFAHALTVGLNVQFARIATNVATRQRYGRMTYPVAAIEALKYLGRLDTTLRFEGLRLVDNQWPTGEDKTLPEELQSLSCHALQITIINAPIFGGQWHLRIPNASMQDRLLDIVVIEEANLSRLNAALARFFNSRGQAASENVPRIWRHPAELSGIPGVHHFQAKGVLLTTSADPCDATLDGEVRGQTPMYVHLAEQHLRVIVPLDDA